MELVACFEHMLSKEFFALSATHVVPIILKQFDISNGSHNLFKNAAFEGGWKSLEKKLDSPDELKKKKKKRTLTHPILYTDIQTGSL